MGYPCAQAMGYSSPASLMKMIRSNIFLTNIESSCAWPSPSCWPHVCHAGPYRKQYSLVSLLERRDRKWGVKTFGCKRSSLTAQRNK